MNKLITSIMKNIKKTLLVALLLTVLPMRHYAQQPSQANGHAIAFDITEIPNFDERIFFLYNLVNDSHFDVITGENDGVFVVSADDAYEGLDLAESFAEFRHQNALAFSKMDKVQAAELSSEYKAMLPLEFTLSLMMDVYVRSRQNNTCANSDPFCTDNGMYQFPAGTNAGSGETGPYYDCLYSTPNPAWYHMRIANPGNIIINMYSNPSVDIDFCCWGPFTDPITPCPNGLTANKVVSCSYSTASNENCIIPATAQTGDYFILIITNYSNQTCNISFSKTGGTGTTDCGILPPLVENDGPYCVGETIYLTANGQAGASYSWTGPGGFTSNQQNPTRPNCTMAMAGEYTCTIALGGATNSATTNVVVYPQPTANFTYTSVCRGNPTQFTSTSTTNPSGQQIQSYQWNFGDGQTGTGQSVTHTYANAGNYTVTLNVSCGNGHCTDQKVQTVPVYAAPVASATANPGTVIYGGTSTLSATAGASGSFNFHWEPENMVVNPNSQTTQTVPLQATQTYTVTVTNPQGGCTSTAQVTVSMEGSNMTAMASADAYVLCEGESTTLHAQPSGGTGNYTYSWSPANSLNNANIQNPVATPPVGTTTYTCNVSDGITSQNVSVTITVHPNMESHIYETICENSYYEFFGQQLQTPGVYDQIIQTQYGCDSTIHLHLDNWPIYETQISDRFCQGDTYQFFDQVCTSSGIYTHTLQSEHGCDSVIKLNLIQNPTYELPPFYESTCEGGEGYYYNGEYLQPSPYPYVYVFPTVMGCDSVVTLYISEAPYNSKTYTVSTCATEYTWPSTGETYTESGTYYATLHYPNACDSTLTLFLDLRPSYSSEVEETSCDSYRWYDPNYNVDITFRNDTVYTHQYYNSSNCLSEVTLYLTINKHTTEEFTVPEEKSCNSYLWDPEGHIYTPGSIYVPGGNTLDPEDHVFTVSSEPNKPYVRTYKDIHGCDSVVSMNVTFEYTPNPNVIYPVNANNETPHWVISATEFQINDYDFNLWDNNQSCYWDSVTWVCEGAPDWLLEPYGESHKFCKLYVLSHYNDTIWLKARAFNRCSPPEGVEQKYWLLCSFYDVEETESSLANFDVVPNPNNGQMTLNFDHLTGKVNIRVYDMRGTIIDNFETYNGIGPCSHTYDMKGRSDGIYLFVASAKEGTVTKKVVIQR